MADELIELGRARKAGAPGLTGVRCLSIGRMLSRTECGLAVAARALSKGQGQDVQMGLNTVRVSIRYVSGALPAGGAISRRILSQVNQMDRELKRGKISKAKAGSMFERLQGLKQDVDRLFATGASLCPGGKGR